MLTSETRSPCVLSKQAHDVKPIWGSFDAVASLREPTDVGAHDPHTPCIPYEDHGLVFSSSTIITFGIQR